MSVTDGIQFVRARQSALPDINALIVRSKQVWRWPEEYLARALPLHEITAADLGAAHQHCFEVRQGDELVAFVSVSEGETRVVVDNLWVEPACLRRGIGKAAMQFVFALARTQGWRQLWVLPDPPAEGFYRALGFADTGERVPSRVSAGPLFSVYRRCLV